MHTKILREDWIPKWKWFKPPKWKIFKWAYNTTGRVTFTCQLVSISPNGNKRFYSLDVLERELREYNERIEREGK